MEFLIYPTLGVVAGLAAGLLGVGGGVIIVPVLIYAFASLRFPPEVLTHMAVGTSLTTIILTSAGSVFQHHKKGAVNWAILRWFALGLALGAFAGAKMADLIQGRVLQLLFGVFAIVIALQMAANVKPKPSRALPGYLGQTGAGVGIGVVSAIFGIGGGSLSVPFLTWCNVKMQEAVGTSSAGGMPIALAGATGFLINGLDEPGLPSYSLGYIYMPAVLGISVTSILFAQLGARLAHRLPAATLKKVFAALLMVVGIKLLVG